MNLSLESDLVPIIPYIVNDVDDSRKNCYFALW